MESDNDFTMRLDAEQDAQASSAVTHNLYTIYTPAPEDILDHQHDSATFGETQQSGPSHYDYHNSFDLQGSQRPGPPHYVPPINIVDPSNSIARNELTTGFPGSWPGFQYSQPAPAAESTVGVLWEATSTPEVINVTGSFAIRFDSFGLLTIIERSPLPLRCPGFLHRPQGYRLTARIYRTASGR
jgi:hypothetical protein